MNFSESESEISLNGRDRRQIDQYIMSNMSIIQSFKNSSSNSRDNYPIPPRLLKLEDIRLPIASEDTIQRYYEVKEQLEHQYQYSRSADRPVHVQQNRPQNITPFLSWPEHFHRKKPISAHYNDAITPWEGSEYMITLLKSLADKLLMKYSFQAMRGYWSLKKVSKDAAMQKYNTKVYDVVSKIFGAWKRYWCDELQRRLSSARGARHEVTVMLQKGLRRWRESTFLLNQSRKLEMLIIERYQRNLLNNALSTLKILCARHNRWKKILCRALKWKQPQPLRDKHDIPEDILIFQNSLTAYRMRYAWQKFLSLLVRRRTKRELQQRGQRLSYRIRKRILVSTICRWLKSMAVSKKLKENVSQSIHSPISPPLVRVDQGSKNSLGTQTSIKKIDKSTSVSNCVVDSDSSYSSNFTQTSGQVEARQDSAKYHGIEPLRATNQQLKTMSSPSTNLDEISTHQSETSDTLSSLQSKSSQSISKLTDDSRQYVLKESNFDLPKFSDTSTMSLPRFDANEGTLPLSYAIHRMENKRKLLPPSTNPIYSPQELPNSMMVASSKFHMSSQVLQDSGDEDGQIVPRNVQVDIMRCRHHMRKKMTSQKEFNVKRKSTHFKNFDEIEKRFKKNQLIRIGEIFRLWKYQSANRKLLKKVFKLSSRRWENRYERTKSSFVLQLTLFSAWKEQVLITKEKRYHRVLNDKALVYRGMNLLAKGFAGLVHGIAMIKREKHAQKMKKLMILAECWISWMMLIKITRQEYQKALEYNHKNLLTNSLDRWKSYVQYCSFEQQTIISIVGYLRVKTYLQRWILALRELRVIKLHKGYVLMRDKEKTSQIFIDWYHCCKIRREIMQGSMLVEKIFLRYRMKRMFVNWPGRDLSLAATAMLHQVKKRIQHQRRESTTPDKLIRGVELNDEIFIPVGETPLSGEKCDHALSTILPSNLPTTGKTITGTIVNSMTSYPHFQWVHLPPTHRPNPPTQIISSKPKLHSTPFLVRGQPTIPKEPPHPLGYQQRAVQLGYSDGLAPTRKVIMKFLRLILRLWKEIAHQRQEISRRGLFLRACSRLRILSKIFYKWSSKTAVIAYRNRIWIGRGNPVFSMFSHTPHFLEEYEEKVATPNMGFYSNGIT